MDGVVRACVDVFHAFHTEADAKQAELFIGLIQVSQKKIDAFISIGKFRSAYLVAVKEELLDDVIRIRDAAAIVNHFIVKICDGYISERNS